MSQSFLLINPDGLVFQTYYDVFRVIHNRKINNKPSYQFDSLITQNIRLIYPGGTDKNIIELLKSLDSANLKNELTKLTKIHGKQKSGISLDTYMARSAPRIFYELLSRLAAVAHELKLYHRLKNKETGNYKVAPCTLSNIKPVLSFRLFKTAQNELAIAPQITIAGQTSPMEDFNGTTFLLEKDSVYYLLSMKDMQTLDWLIRARPEQYKNNAEAFTNEIVSVLERDYEVTKDEVFKINLVESEPQHAVYLSEISDTFLMFTPRWNYEGFLIESLDQPETEEMRRGEIYKVVRRKEEELAFVEKLRGLHPNFEKQRNGNFYLSFDEAKKKHWFLKVYQQLLAENVQIVGMDLLSHFRYSPHNIHTQMNIGRTVDSLMHLNIRISFGDEQVELSAVQRTLYNGQKFILLKDNSIGVITDEWYDQYGAIFKHGKLQKGELIVPQWILLSIEERYQTKELKPVISEQWWKDWERWQTSTEPMVPVPAGLQATLRPYQQKGFEWLVLLSNIDAGACLADDMGLGKTLQTIAFLQHQTNLKPNARHLIVAPLSLVFNWKQELEKFAPGLGLYVFHQNNRDVQEFTASGKQVMITSYGTARSAMEELSLISWDTVVIDESHNIKNPTAQITKAVYKLSAVNRIALSGTPVMNNTFDIYSQLNFLLPGLLGGPEFFKREYAIPIDRDMNMDKTNALQKITAPFVLRRTKKQVAADLPDKTESVIWCQMDEPQKEAYEAIKKQIKSNVFLDIERDGFTKAKFSILQGILKLRQICCAPSLLKDEEITTKDSIKMEMVMNELRDNVSGSKSLVFSQYLGMLEMIAQQCKKENIPYLYFDGSTPLNERAQMVNTFQDENSDVRVFLISLKAGNAGLNLTAAEYVFLMDPWWNNAVEQQAIDRTHRIGQTKNIFAYKLICRNTIEEKILELQQKKRQLSEDLVSEEEGFVKHLTQEDITFLFD
ncbi:MAG: DEAD/DEAH box helicase [Chitinophagales bacterium]